MSEVREWFESGRDRVVPRLPPVSPPDWLAVAVRFCRDGADSLAKRLREVPRSHVKEGAVRCVCDAVTVVPDRGFAECSGRCGRFFLREDQQVWAAKLPVDQ